MSKKPAKPKPMEYGPYKITPPTPGMPFPCWHANGPALDMGGPEQSVRLAAIQANAAYQAGFKAGEAAATKFIAEG